MDSVTQQNAALVEQATAAAESLEQQAQDLTVIVGSFKVDAHSRRLSAPQGSVPPRKETPAKNILPPSKAVALSTDDWEEF